MGRHSKLSHGYGIRTSSPLPSSARICIVKANGKLDLFQEKIHLDNAQAKTNTGTHTHTLTPLLDWSHTLPTHIYSVSQWTSISRLPECKSLLDMKAFKGFTPAWVFSLCAKPCASSGNLVETRNSPSFQEVDGLQEIKVNRKDRLIWDRKHLHSSILSGPMRTSPSQLAAHWRPSSLGPKFNAMQIGYGAQASGLYYHSTENNKNQKGNSDITRARQT